MAAVKKTNAARELDRLGIFYELDTYPVDESDLSAVHAAECMHVDADSVFKTLVVRTSPGGIFLACVPGAEELDFKKFSAVTGNKASELVPLKEVLPLTGYIRGGCSPVGTKKTYPVVIHETAQLYDVIRVSAGQRGIQFVIAPDDLLRAVNGIYADIIR